MTRWGDQFRHLLLFETGSDIDAIGVRNKVRRLHRYSYSFQLTGSLQTTTTELTSRRNFSIRTSIHMWNNKLEIIEILHFYPLLFFAVFVDVTLNVR